MKTWRRSGRRKRGDHQKGQWEQSEDSGSRAILPWSEGIGFLVERSFWLSRTYLPISRKAKRIILLEFKRTSNGSDDGLNALARANGIIQLWFLSHTLNSSRKPEGVDVKGIIEWTCLKYEHNTLYIANYQSVYRVIVSHESMLGFVSSIFVLSRKP